MTGVQHAAPAGQSLRQLRGSLHNASDRQITQVLAMIDALAERGDADELIAPLRPRLAQLRPVRPMTWKRLLFMPLDPIIQPPAQWRRNTVGVPRSALEPIASLLLGDLLAQCRQRSGGDPPSPTDDPLGADTAGAAIWPEAATILAAAVAPQGWQAASGLAPSDFAPLRTIVAGVLRQAALLHPILARAATPLGGQPADDALDPADLAALQRMLSDAAETGAAPALFAVMLARLPNAAALLRLPSSHAMSDQALDFLLDRLEATNTSDPDIAAAADDMARNASLLQALLDPGPTGRPSRRPRLIALRRTLDAQCRERLAPAVSRGILEPLAAAADQATATQMEAMERSARAVRRFATAGRLLGGAEHYDRLLREAAGSVAETSATPLIDRMRLVEILQGPEAALRLMG